MIEDEKFFAWLDGELEPEEAADVAAEVAANPELSRIAAEHRAMSAGLRAAFEPVALAPVPEDIAAAVTALRDDKVVSLAKRRERKPIAFGAPPQWAAIAAALALGVALGSTIDIASPGGPVEVRGGGLYAASSVGRALESQLASANTGDVRIGLTFRDHAGAVCRTFTTEAANGLACRQGDRWKLRGLFAGPEGQSTDYRMAAGPDPQLMALIDRTIEGEPFDAAQEKATKDKGWK